MRKILAMLAVLCLSLPCAAGYTRAVAEGSADSPRLRAGMPEKQDGGDEDDDEDDDEDVDDDDVDDDDDDDDKGGSSFRANDLNFRGPLSDYKPKRTA